MNRKITTLAFALTAAVGALAFSVDFGRRPRGARRRFRPGRWRRRDDASRRRLPARRIRSWAALRTPPSPRLRLGLRRVLCKRVLLQSLGPTYLHLLSPSSDVLLWSTSRAAPAALFFACFRAYGSPASSGASRCLAHRKPSTATSRTKRVAGGGAVYEGDPPLVVPIRRFRRYLLASGCYGGRGSVPGRPDRRRALPRGHERVHTDRRTGARS